MPRKQVLNLSQTEILRNRIFISRTVHIFNLGDVSKGWGISVPTLFRYDSDHHRKISQENTRKVYKNREKIDKAKCQICFEPLKGHERCSICTILLHDNIECYHPIVLINRDELGY